MRFCQKDWDLYKESSIYTLVLLDLDFFIRFCRTFDEKEINDIIIRITEFLEEEISNRGVIFKSDGDEFLIILSDYNEEEAVALMSIIKKLFRKQKFALDSKKDYNNVVMTFSAGLAMFSGNYKDFDAVMKDAVTALFQAKAMRRNKIFVLPPKNDSQIARQYLNDKAAIEVYIGKHGETGFVQNEVDIKEALLWEPQAIACDGEGNIYIVDQNNHSILRCDGEKVKKIIGTGHYGYAGDGKRGSEASLNKPTGFCVDKDYIYVTDTGNDVVRRFSIKTGIIDTIAGTGMAGYEGDGGRGTEAKLNKPGGIAIDRDDNLYINDIANNVIRKLDKNGTISTFAGTGHYGYSGDNDTCDKALFSEIYAIANDYKRENMLIADYYNHCIRNIHFETGIITTIAGCGIAGYDGDGQPALQCRLNKPVGICCDSEGNIFIAESGNSVVRVILKKTGKIYTVAGDGICGTGLNEDIYHFRLCNPNGIAVSEDDIVYILDGANNRVCRIVKEEKEYVR